MAYEYLVPKDTQRLLQNQAAECLNLGLILARYIPHEAVRNDDIFNDRDRAVGKVRSQWLTQMLKRFTGSALEDLITANFQRWIALTQNAARFEMRARGRIIVGLGGKGPLEFGITLHPITGLPYIPGSALKGLCRSYALLSLAAHEKIKVEVETEALKKLDEDLIKGKYDHLPELLGAARYRQAFGSQENAGGCVFYDAVLSNLQPDTRIFTLDVMTPHFVKYYTNSGKKAPDDGDNPNPVSYITITEGVSFAFAIGRRTGFADDDTLKQARRWLRASLQELGVGAKTAQGYGVFAPVKQK
jgi:CRISPR-associated protein Cmr6